jgi:hypothetical protein
MSGNLNVSAGILWAAAERRCYWYGFMTLARNIPTATFMILLSLVVLVPPLQVSGALTCSSSQSLNWKICGPINRLLGGLDDSPTAIQANDGTLRLAWEHATSNGTYNTYYNTRLANGTWMGASLVSNSTGNRFPSLVQASNLSVLLFCSWVIPHSSNSRIYYRTFNGGNSWSFNQNATTTPAGINDTLPATTVGNDGSLWLVWTRENTTTSGTTRQLWYKNLNSAGWTREQSIIFSPTDPNWNFQPSLMVGKDGVIRIAFARGQSSQGNFQTNFIKRSGSGWTPPTPVSISNTTANDQHPSLIQDRNGTLWVFWTRVMTTSFVVRAESSLDNGATWSGETAITSSCSGCYSEQPAAVQSSTDKNIWVFYTTNPTLNGPFSIWALETTSPIFPVHDISLSTPVFSLSNPIQYAGGFPGPYGMSPSETIYVNVQNLGDQPENVTLHLTVSNTTIYSFVQTIPVMGNGAFGNFAFNWNTTGVKPAWYRLVVNATIPIETLGNRGDDAATIPNAIHLFPLGDVNQDGWITIVDISIADLGYGATPGNTRWNSWADITGGGIISIVDINYITYHYGTKS